MILMNNVCTQNTPMGIGLKNKENTMKTKSILTLLMMSVCAFSNAADRIGDFYSSPADKEKLIHDNGNDYQYNSTTKSFNIVDSDTSIQFPGTLEVAPTDLIKISNEVYLSGKWLYVNGLKFSINIPCQTPILSDRLTTDGFPEKAWAAIYPSGDLSARSTPSSWTYIEYTFSSVIGTTVNYTGESFNSSLFSQVYFSGLEFNNSPMDLYHQSYEKNALKVSNGIISNSLSAIKGYSYGTNRIYQVPNNQLYRTNKACFVSSEIPTDTYYSSSSWSSKNFNLTLLEKNGTDYTIVKEFIFPTGEFRALHFLENLEHISFISKKADSSHELSVYDNSTNTLVNFSIASLGSTLSKFVVPNKSIVLRKDLFSQNLDMINKGKDFPIALTINSKNDLFLFNDRSLFKQLDFGDIDLCKAITKENGNILIRTKKSSYPTVFEYFHYDQALKQWSEITEDEYFFVHQAYPVVTKVIPTGDSAADISPDRPTPTGSNKEATTITYTKDKVYNFQTIQTGVTSFQFNVFEKLKTSPSWSQQTKSITTTVLYNNSTDIIEQGVSIIAPSVVLLQVVLREEGFRTMSDSGSAQTIKYIIDLNQSLCEFVTTPNDIGFTNELPVINSTSDNFSVKNNDALSLGVNPTHYSIGYGMKTTPRLFGAPECVIYKNTTNHYLYENLPDFYPHTGYFSEDEFVIFNNNNFYILKNREFNVEATTIPDLINSSVKAIIPGETTNTFDVYFCKDVSGTATGSYKLQVQLESDLTVTKIGEAIQFSIEAINSFSINGQISLLNTASTHFVNSSGLVSNTSLTTDKTNLRVYSYSNNEPFYDYDTNSWFVCLNDSLEYTRYFYPSNYHRLDSSSQNYRYNPATKSYTKIISNVSTTPVDGQIVEGDYFDYQFEESTKSWKRKRK